MEKLKPNQIITVLSIVIGLAGIAGMVFTLPFLFSSRMEDLVGAGFPFVGGSILVIGGLISLSINLNKSNK